MTSEKAEWITDIVNETNVITYYEPLSFSEVGKRFRNTKKKLLV